MESCSESLQTHHVVHDPQKNEIEWFPHVTCDLLSIQLGSLRFVWKRWLYGLSISGPFAYVTNVTATALVVSQH